MVCRYVVLLLTTRQQTNFWVGLFFSFSGVNFCSVCLGDDIDLFDRHSLLLMNYFVADLPSTLTVILSSTESSATDTYSEDVNRLDLSLNKVSDSSGQ